MEKDILFAFLFLLKKIPWVFFFVIVNLLVYMARRRSINYIKNDLTLASGYKKIFRLMYVYGNLFCGIIALGWITGYADNLLLYFNPKKFNVFGIIFYISLLVFFIHISWYVYFKKGDLFLEKHPILHYREGNLFTKLSITPITAGDYRFRWNLLVLEFIIFNIIVWFII